MAAWIKEPVVNGQPTSSETASLPESDYFIEKEVFSGRNK
jgi:hypothetical protein